MSTLTFVTTEMTDPAPYHLLTSIVAPRPIADEYVSRCQTEVLCASTTCDRRSTAYRRGNGIPAGG